MILHAPSTNLYGISKRPFASGSQNFLASFWYVRLYCGSLRSPGKGMMSVLRPVLKNKSNKLTQLNLHSQTNVSHYKGPCWIKPKQ